MSNGIRIGPLWLHRLEQWDLGCRPWLCVHWRYDHGNGCRRIFCLWRWGIQVRPLTLTRKGLSYKGRLL